MEQHTARCRDLDVATLLSGELLPIQWPHRPLTQIVAQFHYNGRYVHIRVRDDEQGSSTTLEKVYILDKENKPLFSRYTRGADQLLVPRWMFDRIHRQIHTVEFHLVNSRS